MRESWDADQWQYIEWLATPRMVRTPPTVEMIAAVIGVDDSTLYRWQNLPGFQEEVNKLARGGLSKKLPDAYGALTREAEAGSYQHLQLLFEMTGEYVRKQHNTNTSDVKGELTFRFVEEETAGGDDAME